MRKDKSIDRVLNQCCNTFGNPLSITTRRRIMEYVKHPTSENWDRICGIVIHNNPLINIWTQLIAVYPTYESLGRIYTFDDEEDENNCSLKEEWATLPSPLQVLSAIGRLRDERINGNLKELDLSKIK